MSVTGNTFAESMSQQIYKRVSLSDYEKHTISNTVNDRETTLIDLTNIPVRLTITANPTYTDNLPNSHVDSAADHMIRLECVNISALCGDFEDTSRLLLTVISVDLL